MTGSSSSSIIIRAATSADIDWIVGIEAHSFRTPWSRDQIEKALVESCAWNLAVTDVRGNGIAYLLCWITAGELHIHTIAVASEWRRRGVARSLMRHALAGAADRGVDEAFLEVRESNAAARSLYETLGFRQLYLRRNYYADTSETAVVMATRVRPSGGAMPE